MVPALAAKVARQESSGCVVAGIERWEWRVWREGEDMAGEKGVFIEGRATMGGTIVVLFVQRVTVNMSTVAFTRVRSYWVNAAESGKAAPSSPLVISCSLIIAHFQGTHT
jgi:hypothetical protein